MDEEKRSSIRLKKNLELQYLCESDPGSASWMMGISRDISETGICFKSDKGFSPSQEIRIRVKFPFNPFEWMEMKARCVNVKGLSIGIYIVRATFLELEEKQKTAINAYLEWLVQKARENP